LVERAYMIEREDNRLVLTVPEREFEPTINSWRLLLA